MPLASLLTVFNNLFEMLHRIWICLEYIPLTIFFTLCTYNLAISSAYLTTKGIDGRYCQSFQDFTVIFITIQGYASLDISLCIIVNAFSMFRTLKAAFRIPLPSESTTPDKVHIHMYSTFKF